MVDNVPTKKEMRKEKARKKCDNFFTMLSDNHCNINLDSDYMSGNLNGKGINFSMLSEIFKTKEEKKILNEKRKAEREIDENEE